MQKLINKKYIVVVNHNNKEFFFKQVMEKEVEFSSIRSMAHHFHTEDYAKSVQSLLKDVGYDANVEVFYVANII